MEKEILEKLETISENFEKLLRNFDLSPDLLDDSLRSLNKSQDHILKEQVNIKKSPNIKEIFSKMKPDFDFIRQKTPEIFRELKKIKDEKRVFLELYQEKETELREVKNKTEKKEYIEFLEKENEKLKNEMEGWTTQVKKTENYIINEITIKTEPGKPNNNAKDNIFLKSLNNNPENSFIREKDEKFSEDNIREMLKILGENDKNENNQISMEKANLESDFIIYKENTEKIKNQWVAEKAMQKRIIQALDLNQQKMANECVKYEQKILNLKEQIKAINNRIEQREKNFSDSLKENMGLKEKLREARKTFNDLKIEKEVLSQEKKNLGQKIEILNEESRNKKNAEIQEINNLRNEINKKNEEIEILSKNLNKKNEENLNQKQMINDLQEIEKLNILSFEERVRKVLEEAEANLNIMKKENELINKGLNEEIKKLNDLLQQNNEEQNMIISGHKEQIQNIFEKISNVNVILGNQEGISGKIKIMDGKLENLQNLAKALQNKINLEKIQKSELLNKEKGLISEMNQKIDDLEKELHKLKIDFSSQEKKFSEISENNKLDLEEKTKFFEIERIKLISQIKETEENILLKDLEINKLQEETLELKKDNEEKTIIIQNLTENEKSMETKIKDKEKEFELELKRLNEMRDDEIQAKLKLVEELAKLKEDQKTLSEKNGEILYQFQTENESLKNNLIIKEQEFETSLKELNRNLKNEIDEKTQIDQELLKLKADQQNLLEKYEKCQLEIEFLKSKISTTEQEFDAKLKDLNKVLEDQINEKTKLDQELTKLKEVHQNMLDNNEKTKVEIESLKNQINFKEQEFDSDLKKLNKILEDEMKKNTKLDEEIATQQTNHKNLLDQNEKSQLEIESLLNKMKNKEQEYDTSLKNFNKALEDEMKAKSELGEQLDILKEYQQNLLNENEKKQLEIESLKTTINIKEQEYDDALKNLQKLLEEKIQNNTVLNEDIIQLKEDQKILSEKHEDLLDNSKKEIASLQNKLNAKQQEFEIELENLKKLLDDEIENKKKLSEELAALKEDHNILSEKHDEISDKSQLEILSLRNNLNGKDQELTILKEKLCDEMKAKSILDEELSQLKEDQNILSQKNSEIFEKTQQEIETYKKTMEAANFEITNLKQQINSSNEQIIELKELITNLKNQELIITKRTEKLTEEKKELEEKIRLVEERAEQTLKISFENENKLLTQINEATAQFSKDKNDLSEELNNVNQCFVSCKIDLQNSLEKLKNFEIKEQSLFDQIQIISKEKQEIINENLEKSNHFNSDIELLNTKINNFEINEMGLSNKIQDLTNENNELNRIVENIKNKMNFVEEDLKNEKELCENLKSKIDLLELNIQNSQTKILELTKNNENLNKNLNDAYEWEKEIHMKFELENEKLSKNLKIINEKMVNFQFELTKVSGILDKLKEKEKKLENEIQLLKNEKQCLSSEIKNLNEKIIELEKKWFQSNEYSDNLTKEFQSEKETLLSEIKKQIQLSNDLLREKNEMEQKLNREIYQKETKIKQFENEIQTLFERIQISEENEKTMLINHEIEIQTFLTQKQELEEKIILLVNEKTQLNKEIISLCEELKTERDKYNESLIKIGEIVKENNFLEKTLEKKEIKIENLKKKKLGLISEISETIETFCQTENRFVCKEISNFKKVKSALMMKIGYLSQNFVTLKKENNEMTLKIKEICSKIQKCSQNFHEKTSKVMSKINFIQKPLHFLTSKQFWEVFFAKKINNLDFLYAMSSKINKGTQHPFNELYYNFATNFLLNSNKINYGDLMTKLYKGMIVFIELIKIFSIVLKSIMIDINSQNKQDMKVINLFIEYISILEKINVDIEKTFNDGDCEFKKSPVEIQIRRFQKLIEKFFLLIDNCTLIKNGIFDLGKEILKRIKAAIEEKSFQVVGTVFEQAELLQNENLKLKEEIFKLKSER